MTSSNEKLIESLSSFAIAPVADPVVHDGHCEEECEECDYQVLALVQNGPKYCKWCNQPSAKEGDHECVVQDAEPASKMLAFDLRRPGDEEFKRSRSNIEPLEECPNCANPYMVDSFCETCNEDPYEPERYAQPKRSPSPDDLSSNDYPPASRVDLKRDIDPLLSLTSMTINDEPIDLSAEAKEKEYWKLKNGAAYGKPVDQSPEALTKFRESVEKEWKVEEERRQLISQKIKDLERQLETGYVKPKEENTPKANPTKFVQDLKGKTKKFAAKNAEFMSWYQMNVNNGDLEKDYLQAINWLVQRFVASGDEEDRNDWELVQEVFEENTRVFRDRVKAKMDELNANVTTTTKAQQASLRFNGFLYLTIMVPTHWFQRLREKGGKIDDKNARKFFDCRKIAPMPHPDETVQLNPELSVTKDKAFAEAYIQYDNVLNKVMHFINGPATKEVIFFNGALIKPLLPTVVTKMMNAQKNGEEAKLDALLAKLCVQLVPSVVVVEFVGDNLDPKTKIMEDRGYHLDKMGWLTTVCESMGILAAQKPAGGSAEK